MTALNPLPSLLRASARDAADMQARKAGRIRWNDDDWNRNAEVLERLIRQCYTLEQDHNQPDMCFVLFQAAEKLERLGELDLNSNIEAMLRGAAA